MMRQVNLTAFILLKMHVNVFWTAKNDVNFSHAQIPSILPCFHQALYVDVGYVSNMCAINYVGLELY